MRDNADPMSRSLRLRYLDDKKKKQNKTPKPKLPQPDLNPERKGNFKSFAQLFYVL
ncbi:MAG: hypothetical protein LBL41_00115 [Bifidobacteriaceae bacterium]|nr:hypothetical protein [Bifidobacteriaceae bacterium]